MIGNRLPTGEQKSLKTLPRLPMVADERQPLKVNNDKGLRGKVAEVADKS